MNARLFEVIPQPRAPYAVRHLVDMDRDGTPEDVRLRVVLRR